MIELIQFPCSPFCIPSRRLLEFAGVKFKIVNILPQDRDFVWKVTKHGHNQMPASQPRLRDWHRRMKTVRGAP